MVLKSLILPKKLDLYFRVLQTYSMKFDVPAKLVSNPNIYNLCSHSFIYFLPTEPVIDIRKVYGSTNKDSRQGSLLES